MIRHDSETRQSRRTWTVNATNVKSGEEGARPSPPLRMGRGGRVDAAGGPGTENAAIARRERTFAATVAWTFARCSSLPLKTGVVYPGTFLRRWTTSACCPGTWRWPVASESAWAEFLLGGVDMVESGMVYESVAH